jgi:NTE family protein
MPRCKTLAAASLLFLLAALPVFECADSVPFYSDESILSVARPIEFGGEAFPRRARARAGGGEPFGLVLSGGSARAFAHIGVLEVLEEEGLRPDFLVGDSMGAIIALLYGAGVAPGDIAALFEIFPANRLFDSEFPLSGGFLDAGRAVALLRALGGDLDLSELPIPVLVVCEDLISRRQVLLAEGDLPTVAEASFALPAIFKPVRFRDMLLIDGGATNLVPVDAAYRYSGKIAVATSFCARELGYASPFAVINRAIDIGKTRRSIEGMLARNPVVIRSEVEAVPSLRYSRLEEIAALGRASAQASLGEIRALVPGGRTTDAVLADRRAYFHERVVRLAAAARLGASFPVPPHAGVAADLRVLDDAAGESEVFSGRRWIGPEAAFRSGPMRVSLSSLAGLEGRKDRAWGLGFDACLRGYRFPSRDEDESGVAMDAGLQAVLSGSGLLDCDHSSSEPREIAAVASGGAALAISRCAILKPRIQTELDQYIPETDSFRRGTASLLIETLPGSRLDLGLGTELSLDSDENLAPAARMSLAWEPAGLVALRLRGLYRSVLRGPGLEAFAADQYRSSALEGRAERRFLCGTEVAWLARPLEASLGDLAVVDRPELGLYADFSGAEGAEVSSGGFETRLTIGVSASAGLSPMGLAPLVLSSYAGLATDGSGWVFALRAGRFFD